MIHSIPSHCCSTHFCCFCFLRQVSNPKLGTFEAQEHQPNKQDLFHSMIPMKDDCSSQLPSLPRHLEFFSIVDVCQATHRSRTEPIWPRASAEKLILRYAYSPKRCGGSNCIDGTNQRRRVLLFSGVVTPHLSPRSIASVNSYFRLFLATMPGPQPYTPRRRDFFSSVTFSIVSRGNRRASLLRSSPCEMALGADQVLDLFTGVVHIKQRCPVVLLFR